MTCMNPTVTSYLPQTSWAIKAREILNKFILPTQRFCVIFRAHRASHSKTWHFWYYEEFPYQCHSGNNKKTGCLKLQAHVHSYLFLGGSSYPFYIKKLPSIILYT